MPNKITHSEFLKRFKKRYGHQFRVIGEYRTAKEKLQIECKQHGIFDAAPDTLLNKRRTTACPKCASGLNAQKQRYSTKDFIEKAKLAIGEHYDFSNTVYVGSKTKVLIACRIHGEFKARPAVLLYQKRGCPDCMKETKGDKLRLNLSELERRLVSLHPTISFDLSGYKNNRTKIKCECSKHGIWHATSSNLSRGRGCPSCGLEKNAKSRALSSTEWIKKARAVHGMRYRYHLVEYKNAKTLVKILCRKHGVFECRPGNHVSLGRGCPNCAGVQSSAGKRRPGKSIGQVEFIKRVSKHPDAQTLDFSKSVYKAGYENVTVRCKIHGEFQVSPSNLFNGSGCPDCGREKAKVKRQLPLKEFVRRARQHYGTKYDYSETTLDSLYGYVSVTCREHGAWMVLASNHVIGKSGCPVCAKMKFGKRQKEKNTKTTEEFIARSEKIHGLRYDYSQTEYVHVNKNLTIKCREHGPFNQRASSHLAGKGCPECGKIERAGKQILSAEVLIERFREAHGKRYDYSEVKYLGLTKKVKILCPEHGEFYQAPRTHLERKGCPECSLSKGETAIANILNENAIDYLVEYKVPEAVPEDANLRYDFFIPSLNLLIEYDGEQHFMPVTFGGMSKKAALRVHSEVVLRDKRKNRLAKRHGYKLLRIKYSDNLSSKLTKKLNA